MTESVVDRFSHFVGIDWSGAKGRRHKGLAVALCAEGVGSPKVVKPFSGNASWSREEVAEWIAGGCGLPAEARILVGIDSSFSMPYVDKGTYLDETFGAHKASDLWRVTESLCQQGLDLYGGPFVNAHADHYLRTGERGARYARRMRVPEVRAVQSGAGPCESVFHLIGPSQVGLSGLSTMRMLDRLNGTPGLAIWPFEDPADSRTVLVEIYAAAFAALGQYRGKVRDRNSLNMILQHLMCEPFRRRNIVLDDHIADAIVTAAALRVLAPQRKYWYPPQLSTMVRRTEGWVFGIL